MPKLYVAFRTFMQKNPGEPPILGLLQRGGEVVVKMLVNVQQATIRPIIETGVARGTLIHTDQYEGMPA